LNLADPLSSARQDTFGSNIIIRSNQKPVCVEGGGLFLLHNRLLGRGPAVKCKFDRFVFFDIFVYFLPHKSPITCEVMVVVLLLLLLLWLLWLLLLVLLFCSRVRGGWVRLPPMLHRGYLPREGRRSSGRGQRRRRVRRSCDRRRLVGPPPAHPPFSPGRSYPLRGVFRSP